MEQAEKTVDSQSFQKGKIHHILAHSYLFYFLVFLISLFFDFVFPLKMFSGIDLSLAGLVVLFIGTLLILWAQHASHTFQERKKEGIDKSIFFFGPYRYMRSPTHYGLLVLMIGFGIIMNAFFVTFLSFLAFFITKISYLRREEDALVEKYGNSYLEYQKAVKF